MCWGLVHLSPWPGICSWLELKGKCMVSCVPQVLEEPICVCIWLHPITVYSYVSSACYMYAASSVLFWHTPHDADTEEDYQPVKLVNIRILSGKPQPARHRGLSSSKKLRPCLYHNPLCKHCNHISIFWYMFQCSCIVCVLYNTCRADYMFVGLL